MDPLMTNAVQDLRVETTVRGRYLLQAPRRPGGLLLVGFHGYAEAAEAQLERLVGIPGSDEWLLVSVQALHPFYRGRSNEVVANWMTRFDRERAIEDNLRYVTAVLDTVAAAHEVRAIVHAGFSQGVAMAFRAALGVPRRSRGVIALGGDVPPELAALPPETWRDLQVLIGRGTHDEWYSHRKMDADVALLQDRPVHLRRLVFEGGHEWTDAFNKEAGRLLASVAASRTD